MKMVVAGQASQARHSSQRAQSSRAQTNTSKPTSLPQFRALSSSLALSLSFRFATITKNANKRKEKTLGFERPRIARPFATGKPCSCKRAVYDRSSQANVLFFWQSKKQASQPWRILGIGLCSLSLKRNFCRSLVVHVLLLDLLNLSPLLSIAFCRVRKRIRAG